MQFQTASFFLLASVFCSYTAEWGQRRGVVVGILPHAFMEEALDCCLSTSNVPIPHRIVVSFNVQTTEGGCPIPATVFITKKDMALCAPPPTGDNWVTKVICKISPKEPGCRPTKKTKPKRKKMRGARQ